MKTRKFSLMVMLSICLMLALACGGGAGPGGPEGGGAASPGGGGRGGGGAAGPAAGGGREGGGPVSPGGGRGGDVGPAPGRGGAAPGGGISRGGGVAPGGGAADQVRESVSDAASNDEVNQIIEQYARDVLGIGVTVIGSGSRDGSLNVPVSTESGMNAAADLAGTTYAGVLQGGAASVTFGGGQVSGDVSGDIQNASLGSYSFIQPGTAAADEGSALAVLQATFPGIADRPYSAVEASSGGGGGQGFNFMAQSQQQEVDVRSGQAVIIAEVALIGVTVTDGQSVLYAVVGRGDFATSLGR